MTKTTSLLFILLAGSISAVAEAVSAQAQEIYIEIADYCSPPQIATDISQCGQAAIAAAGAGANASTGGGTVHFPAGLYKLLGTLTLDKSFVGLSGDGPQASYIRCANGATPCVVVGISGTPTRDQHIDNMAINGDGAKTGGANISIRNTFNVRVELPPVSLDSYLSERRPG